MNRQLTIQELSAYLPYGVQFQSWMDKPFDDYGKQPIWTLDGINKMFGDYCLLTKENNDAYTDRTCRLILYPLSSLTKEITHKGETFVPIEWLDEKYYTLDYENQCKRLLEEDGENWINQCDYMLVEHLLEWHFDIFGLIEQGLAIDKTTL